jgi:hypothetical protein
MDSPLLALILLYAKTWRYRFTTLKSCERHHQKLFSAQKRIILM